MDIVTTRVLPAANRFKRIDAKEALVQVKAAHWNSRRLADVSTEACGIHKAELKSALTMFKTYPTWLGFGSVLSFGACICLENFACTEDEGREFFC